MKKTFIEYFIEKETEQELLEKKSRKKKSAKKKVMLEYLKLLMSYSRASKSKILLAKS